MEDTELKFDNTVRSQLRNGDALALKNAFRRPENSWEVPMKRRDSGVVATPDEAEHSLDRSILGLHGVRYQTADVQRAADFYVTHLGFTLEHQHLPAFATVSLGSLKLLLSGPGASGSRTMPDGRRQEPGGWNRIVLHVTDVAREIERLRKAGVKLRNEMEAGPAGRQVQLEDPDGNPIELFEPAP